MKSKRYPLPARITLALALVLITAAWNVVRLWAGLSLSPALQNYAPFPGPAYIALTGALSAGLGLAVTWAVLLRHRWAPRALLGVAIAYATWRWVDRIFLQPTAGPGWPFALLITVLLLSFIAAVTLDRRNRWYFGREAHEREEQDRPTA
jgi:hypothetical protein